MTEQKQPEDHLIKVVYFDEQSASDYLDISAGGKTMVTTEQIRDRTTRMQGDVEAKVAAKLSWLPFIGGSAEASGEVDISRVGQSILSKTLSNTILTDYLAEVTNDKGVERMHGLKVSAPKDSMAFVKMYTPYMIIMNTADHGMDLGRMDEAFESAKGYYELIAEGEGRDKCVLRFNISAFRNNYGLADLGRMDLVFHGVRVGRTTEAQLNINVEMAGGVEPPSSSGTSARDLLRSAETADPGGHALDVYDVILAGVQRGK